MAAPDPPTVAEASGFTATSRHDDVLRFLEQLRSAAPGLSLQSMGKSAQGQELPVVVLSAQRRFTPAEAHASGQPVVPVVMVLANIHAGEVEGKEAVLALARDVAFGAAPPLARLSERAILVLVPDYNCDGNDRIDPAHRALDLVKLEGQIGPVKGVGTRNTAQGYNLNRDYVKLEAPESRRLMDLWHAWRPHLTIDCHTTNGSIHGYHLTFDTAHLIPSSPAAPILHVRDVLLPEVARRLQARTGFRTFFYGNFRDPDDPTSGWQTYPGLPRFGSHYRGLTGRMDVLLECYSYLEFRQRCEVMSATLVELLDWVRERGEEIVRIVAQAEADTVRRGADPSPDDRLGIDYTELARSPRGGVVVSHPIWPLPARVEICAWDLESQRARRVPGRTLTRYPNTHFGRFLPTRTVCRPFAYAIPRAFERIADHLRLHHVRVLEVVRARTVDVLEFVVDGRAATSSVDIADRSPPETVFFGHELAARHELVPGDFLVPMAQPLAHVAIYLLEPQSDDGLVKWRFFDDVADHTVFPIRRIPRPFAP